MLNKQSGAPSLQTVMSALTLGSSISIAAKPGNGPRWLRGCVPPTNVKSCAGSRPPIVWPRGTRPQCSSTAPRTATCLTESLRRWRPCSPCTASSTTSSLSRAWTTGWILAKIRSINVQSKPPTCSPRPSSPGTSPLPGTHVIEILMPRSSSPYSATRPGRGRTSLQDAQGTSKRSLVVVLNATKQSVQYVLLCAPTWR